MYLVLAVIAIIAIIVTILVLGCKEGYKPCHGDCNTTPLPKGGLVQINPFVWPYSAYANPDVPYMSRSANIQVAPMTHQSTPDHVVLTN